jgi:hypothetical protein
MVFQQEGDHLPSKKRAAPLRKAFADRTKSSKRQKKEVDDLQRGQRARTMLSMIKFTMTRTTKMMTKMMTKRMTKRMMMKNGH